MTASEGPRGDRRRRIRTAVLIALLPGLLGIALARWPPAEGLERKGLDWLFRARGERPRPPDVCVVAIDGDSYQVLGVPTTGAWPRRLHAQLLRTLAREGAKAVAFDVLFTEARDPEEDAEFEKAVAETGFVVLGATVEQVRDPRFNQAQIIEPYAPFAAAAAAVGDVNLPTDHDTAIRYAWLRHGDRLTLALAAYEVATRDASHRETGARFIDYFGPGRTVETVSVYQALDPAQHLRPGFFRGKIVFVGAAESSATGPAAKDAFRTPFTGAGGETTFGVEIHATLAANLLEKRRIDLLPKLPEAALLLALPLLASLTFMTLGPLAGAFAFLALEALPFGAGYAAFRGFGLWIPVIIPAAVQLPIAYGASVLWYYLTTRRDRERIRRAFSFYLSPDMIRRITAHPEALHLGGEEIVATAVMTDLKGFSAISEGQPATETVRMLNEYFSGITEQIFETGGTLIKFIGDAVFAIWGAPLPMDDHATRACRAALAMARMKGQGQSDAVRALVTRIGVHTGPMVVGNLGSSQRFDYTAIGDAVNLAARLEGLNKLFGTFALVSGAALAQTDGRFVVRPIGRVRVVGRQAPVEIHELLGVKGEATIPDEAAIAAFGLALADFAAGRLDAAAVGFRDVAARCVGGDGPSAFYLKMIERLQGEPLPPDWTGVIAAESK